MLMIDNLTSIEENLCNWATLKKQPIGGSLELLPLCNMNCDMCYVRLSPEQVKRKGAILSGKEWISLAEQMKESGVLFLLLTGGEPFLHPDFQEIYLHFYKMGMVLTINTNGTLITKELAEFLGKYRPRRVNVTLYGGSDETYEKLCHNPNGLTQTLNGIKLLQKYNVDVKLNGSLVKGNCQDIDNIIRISNELGLYLKVDTYMYPVSRERDGGFCSSTRLSAKEAAYYDVEIHKMQLSSEDFKMYCKEVLDLINSPDADNELRVMCRAGRSSFMINWQGNMQPCSMVSVPSLNVFEYGFWNSWQNMTKIIDKIRFGNACASCKKRKFCQVCMGSTISETGRIEGTPQYLCEYIEEIIRLVSEIEK